MMNLRFLLKTSHCVRFLANIGDQFHTATSGGLGILCTNYTAQFFRCYSVKAAVCHNLEEPLKIDDIKGKKLKKGEIKIKVHYCAFNPRDLLLLQGHVKEKVPFTPGYEVAGEVLERFKGGEDNEEENTIEVGDKVVALTKESLGGLSSHCIALKQDVWKYNSLAPKIAAALPVNYGHALLSLFRRAKIKKSSTVLVTAESGGLGLAALHIAANVYKAKAIGVCSSDEKADFLREHGAWSAVKMSDKSLTSSVKKATEGKGVDIVYETVGGDFLTGALPCLRHEGLLILADIPHLTDTINPAHLFDLHTFNITAITLDQYRKHDVLVYRQAVSDAIELCEQNLISPYISKVFSLDDVNEAVKQIKDDKDLGKILIEMPH